MLVSGRHVFKDKRYRGMRDTRTRLDCHQRHEAVVKAQSLLSAQLTVFRKDLTHFSPRTLQARVMTGNRLLCSKLCSATFTLEGRIEKEAFLFLLLMVIEIL